MRRLLVAAVLIAALSYAGGLLVTSALALSPDTYLYAVVLAPLIEESARYGIARAVGPWRLNLRAAAILGLWFGALELCAKLYNAGVHPAFDVKTLLSVAGFATSLPIHAALSVVFYGLPRRRWPIMVGLHASLNLMLLVGLSALWGTVSIPAYAAISLAAVTALCAALALAMRRMARTGGQEHVRFHLW